MFRFRSVFVRETRVRGVTVVQVFLALFLLIKMVDLSHQNRNHAFVTRNTGARTAKELSIVRKNLTCLQRPRSHRLSVLQGAKLEDVRTEPFPYIVIKDALPEPIYSALERHFLSDRELLAETTGSLTQRMRSNYRYSVKADALLGFKKQSKIKRISPIVREFAKYHTSTQFVQEVLWLFREKLSEYRPDLLRKFQNFAKNGDPNLLASPDKNNGKYLIKTEVELVINSPVLQGSSSVRRIPS